MRRQRQEIHDAPLTAEIIRDILWKAKALPPPERLPADVEEQLARRLELIRDRYRIDQRAEAINAARLAAKRNMAAAREELSKVRACQDAYLTNAKNTVSDSPQLQHIIDTSCRALEDEIRQTHDLGQQLGQLMDASALEERSNRTGGWLQYGPDIFTEFRRALATAGINLGVRVGGGKKKKEAGAGPAGRILEQLVPLLTGEKTTAGSAAKQLNEARRRGKVATAKIPRRRSD